MKKILNNRNSGMNRITKLIKAGCDTTSTISMTYHNHFVS